MNQESINPYEPSVADDPATADRGFKLNIGAICALWLLALMIIAASMMVLFQLALTLFVSWS